MTFARLARPARLHRAPLLCCLACLAALATVMAPVSSAQQVDPLSTATEPPPSGHAYVLDAPNGPDWLTLSTQKGQWLIQLSDDCVPAVVQPDTNVVLYDGEPFDGSVVNVHPLEIDTVTGQNVANLKQFCTIQDARVASNQRCAELEGECDIAALAADLGGEP